MQRATPQLQSPEGMPLSALRVDSVLLTFRHAHRYTLTVELLEESQNCIGGKPEVFGSVKPGP